MARKTKQNKQKLLGGGLCQLKEKTLAVQARDDGKIWHREKWRSCNLGAATEFAMDKKLVLIQE